MHACASINIKFRYWYRNSKFHIDILVYRYISPNPIIDENLPCSYNPCYCLSLQVHNYYPCTVSWMITVIILKLILYIA